MRTTAPTTETQLLVAGLAWRQVRRGALIWGGVFALTIVSSLYAYEATYGTPAERAALLRGLAANAGMRALFGPVRDVDTVGGFLAWRTIGILPLVAAVWGLLVTTRLLRGEEDSGRWATILTGRITRGGATLATFAAVLAASSVLLAATAASILVGAVWPGGIDVAGGLWLAVASCIAAPAFAAVGALTSQLAPTRRVASALAAAVFGLAFVLRVAADATSATWLRWLTPLGWIEELRPLTGSRPLVVLPLIAWTALLTAAAVWLSSRRDDRASPLTRSDERPPRDVLLTSPMAFALRESLPGAAGWALALGVTALLFGALADSVARLARESAGIREHVSATTRAQVDVTSAQGYLALMFVLFAVVVALYAATHATAARVEEATGRLDTLLVRPVGRRPWLAGRLAVAAVCCIGQAAVMAVAAWAGAVLAGARIGFGGMVEAGANMLPVVALFVGVGALALAFVPRHTGAVAFGSVALAYLWEETGALVDAPAWILDVSPFHWLALVPVQPVDWRASAVLVAGGVAAAALAVERFRRRDIVAG